MKKDLNDSKLSCEFNADDKTLNLTFENLDPSDCGDELSAEEIDACFVATMGQVVDYVEEILPLNNTSILIEQLLLIHASDLLFAMKCAKENTDAEIADDSFEIEGYDKSLFELLKILNEERDDAIDFCINPTEDLDEEEPFDISQEIISLKNSFKKMKNVDLEKIEDGQGALFNLGEQSSQTYIKLCDHFESTDVSPLIAAWSFAMASMILAMLRQEATDEDLAMAPNVWQHFFSSIAHYVLGEEEDEDDYEDDESEYRIN
jgi:hypothetical protein